jgi:hypothetical protein
VFNFIPALQLSATIFSFAIDEVKDKELRVSGISGRLFFRVKDALALAVLLAKTVKLAIGSILSRLASLIPE